VTTANGTLRLALGGLIAIGLAGVTGETVCAVAGSVPPPTLGMLAAAAVAAVAGLVGGYSLSGHAAGGPPPAAEPPAAPPPAAPPASPPALPLP